MLCTFGKSRHTYTGSSILGSVGHHTPEPRNWVGIFALHTSQPTNLCSLGRSILGHLVVLDKASREVSASCRCSDSDWWRR